MTQKYLTSNRIIAIICILLTAVLFLSGVTGYWFYTVEDAYISFRYAENLLEGKGLVYNAGDRVEGYTNFLWVLILSVLRLIFPFPQAAKFAGALLGGFTLLLMINMFSRECDRRVLGPVAALLLAVSPGYQLWSVAGLETPLFVFLLVAAVYSDRNFKQYSTFLSGLFFGLATLTRPEGFLFCSLYHVVYLREYIKTPKKLLWLVAGFGCVVIPHVLFRWSYYSAWVPNTYWVKSKRFNDGRMAYFIRYTAMTGFLIGPVALAGIFKMRFTTRYLALVTTSIGYLLYVFWVGGDWMPMGRFFIPVLPFLALASVQVFQTRQKKIWISGLMVFVVITAAIAGVSAKFDMLRWRKSHYIDVLTWETAHMVQWKAVGQWFAENTGSGQSMSTGLGGIIPYYSGITNIDRGGLNDKVIAGIIHQSKNESMEKAAVDREVYLRCPTFLLDESHSFNMLLEKQPDGETEWFRNSVFRDCYQFRSVEINGKYLIYYERLP